MGGHAAVNFYQYITEQQALAADHQIMLELSMFAAGQGFKRSAQGASIGRNAKTGADRPDVVTERWAAPQQGVDGLWYLIAPDREAWWTARFPDKPENIVALLGRDPALEDWSAWAAAWSETGLARGRAGFDPTKTYPALGGEWSIGDFAGLGIPRVIVPNPEFPVEAAA